MDPTTAMVYDWRGKIAEIIAERDRLIIEAYTTTDQNATEVGAVFGVSHTTVTNVLADHGIPARPRSKVPRVCWHCGERIGTEKRTELFHAVSNTQALVHTEPCGAWLLEKEGWKQV